MSIARAIMSASGGEPEGAWDLSFAYYDPPEGFAWNLSKAVYSGKNISVAAEELAPTDLFFKPDGTKMYVIGATGDDVNEYNLSTPWDITSETFVQRFAVNGQDTSPLGLFFKSDGTRMYVSGNENDSVYEYSLSTAWDISSASYVQGFSVAAQEATPSAVFFKPDGLKMYVVGNVGQDVNEYDLSTAWDISTASFLQTFSIAAQEANPNGLFFKPDGTKMYVLGNTGDDVNEYDLSTPWDISTASFLQSFSVAAQETNPQGLYIKPDGTVLYIVGNVNDRVDQYTIGGVSVSAQDTSPQGLFFKPDGTKMYIVGNAGDDVNEYDLSTAWDISTTSFLQTFSIAAQEANPDSLFFKPDGTKMYVLGNAGDDVNEYDLSTAWDISTASFLQTFSIAAQESNPDGLFFKPDGTKMYVLGNVGNDVNEYDLSTAWDISTASFLQLFSVSAQEIAPEGVFFRDDGLKMYVVGGGSGSVNEYDLSTAWDISTASFLQLFSVELQEIYASGIFFKPDGTQMFISGVRTNAIYSYTLGPQ
jgi:sugar lactone lactonase YvrE